MIFNVRLGILLLASLLTVTGTDQQRFGSENPRFKGFLKSPTEHIMNEFEGVPELRVVVGRIIEASSGTGIPDAAFELRTENPDGRVRGARTDSKGRFRLRSVSEGLYVFKVTKAGFQSVFGKIRVTKRARPNNTLTVQLRQGV
jgi:hypothetical protein